MYFRLFSLSRELSYLKQSDLSPPLFNSKIKALVQQGLFFEALQLYSKEGLSPRTISTKFTFPSLLRACAALSRIRHGKAMHSTIITMGLYSDPYIAASLINMYVKCGSLGYAVQVFAIMSDDEASAHDVTLWNSVIDGYFRYGQIDEGLLNFIRMQSLGIRPDAYSLSILLGMSEGLLGYMEGKQIHGYALRNVFDGDPFLDTALISMYSSFGRPIDAWYVFDKLADKNNVVVWSALISGLCDNGLWKNSLELFSLAKNENITLGSASFSGVLTACGYDEDAYFGWQVHCDVIKTGFQSDPYVCTSLLSMYAKCGLVEFAEYIFYRTPNKEVELWNAIVSAYVGNGCAYDALDVYNRMRLSEIPIDSFTMSNILSCCSVAQLYNFGRTLHAELIKKSLEINIAVQSALLTMYSKCGCIEDANSVFFAMKERDVVAWGSMISGLTQNKKFSEALNLFRAMEVAAMKPDSDIMASVINACMGLENAKLGCGIHGFVIKIGLGYNVFVATSLIDMYSKCGFVEMARNVFADMPHRNLVAWNSIISCYSRNGMPELSIGLFTHIRQHGLYPDSVSVTSALVAISSVAALLKGKAVHGYQIRLQIPSDLQVENALIDMYIKCGSLKYAQHIFQSMCQRNLVTWNSMIDGYGSHGDCLKAIQLFDDMRRSGMIPDDVTFLSLISSCSHSGMIEEGLNLFYLMRGEYRIEPRMEHYVNVVDLLSRAGSLDDAYNFIQNMPIDPDGSVWLCLLCACRSHRNIQLGELASQNLLRLKPFTGSNYVHLLNLYGEAESWDKAATLRASMKEKGLKKNPGCSWIEVRNRVDVFFSGDTSSPRTLEIYETLGTLKRNMEGIKRLSEKGV